MKILDKIVVFLSISAFILSLLAFSSVIGHDNSLGDQPVQICTERTLTKSLVCESTDTVYPLTKYSTDREITNWVDSCPSDIVIVDDFNCIGKYVEIKKSN